ncbi:MAG: FadR family transcriptional regulator [Oscillospiraceae bacterium]|nr:FadR family transcriptional regulator [Oscillospiraceae bacterium]
MAEQASYLKNLKSESVVQKVINCLTDGMVSGELKPGDKLPTEPELAATLGVARTSVREATKILTYLGVLESRRSEGTFVANGFQESMIDPMVYGIILNKGEDFDSLMELRELTEVGILRLAIKKRSEEGLETIREKLDAFSDAVEQENLTAAFQADNDFHDAVSSLCQNDLVDKINRVVRVLTYAVRQKTVYTMIQTGRGQELLQAHWKIYEILYTKNMEGLEEFIHDTYFLDVASENK